MDKEFEKGNWEKKNQEQFVRDRYQYGGDRYSFWGTDHHLPDDIIPQIVSLYPFPKESIQEPLDVYSPEQPSPAIPKLVPRLGKKTIKK
jgi:hypothetical protein